MSEILSFFLVIAIILISIRFFIAQNSYEKILSFYFIFTNLILLILIGSVTNFDSILDIIILLFLLKLMAVLFLLFNRKKI
jgi:multisubunit Na+/H+ antiporter MnhF subunit